tara:strand:- start:57 stop:254 length:198 start_codon:yes stop_codon:yes gene_type:complete
MSMLVFLVQAVRKQIVEKRVTLNLGQLINTHCVTGIDEKNFLTSFWVLANYRMNNVWVGALLGSR